MNAKRVFSVALVALFLCACGFVVGWAASRRLSRMTYPDLARAYLTEPGDAPPEVRAGVLQALSAFEEGYLQRDPQKLESFMQRLFPQDQHILVLGTETGEWRQGYDSVKRFIRGDWSKWGNVRLEIDDAVVCSSGDVAWVATIGTVRIGRSPRSIRLVAVLTHTNDRWVFRHIQFQWDLGSVAFFDLFRPDVFSKLHLQ